MPREHLTPYSCRQGTRQAMALLLVLLPLPGSLPIPTPTQGSRHKGRAGTCALQRASGQGQPQGQELDRTDITVQIKTGVRKELVGTVPSPGQVQHLLPSSVHCATVSCRESQSTKQPWGERSWSWSYGEPGLCSVGIHKDLLGKYHKHHVPSYSGRHHSAQAPRSWAGRRRYSEMHQSNRTHAQTTPTAPRDLQRGAVRTQDVVPGSRHPPPGEAKLPFLHVGTCKGKSPSASAPSPTSS